MGLIPYGVISRPHGLGGGVRLITYSGDLSNLEFIKSVYIKIGESEEFTRYNIEGHSISGRHAVLMLEGIDTIDNAEKLKGVEIYVETDELQQTENNEFYYYELQGLPVYDLSNNLIGNVIKLNDSGPQELLEVELKDGKEVLIPFLEPILVEIDMENKKIVVNPPPGLLEL
ncbi:MAG: 16S rRNA processing protein RimM [Candidatus Dadabacteria bacterium]|nr:16S rRNA processing protein RimM [Candidatus Dadabacteria bacterium]